MRAQPETYFLTSATTRETSSANEFDHPTGESARHATDAALENSAESIWIVDREGNSILPADQGRFRASASRSAPGVR